MNKVRILPLGFFGRHIELLEHYGIDKTIQQYPSYKFDIVIQNIRVTEFDEHIHLLRKLNYN
jgi:hypothetical protein